MREPPSRGGIATAAVAVILLATLVIPAVSALHVDGIKILMDVQPGKTYTYPMGISIDQNDPATDIAVDIKGFGQSGDGTYLGITPAEDISPFSARSFVSVDAPAFHLLPGGSRSFNATIRVPAGVGAGGRYATIYIHPQASKASGASAGITTAVLVPVMLTVQGTALIETGSITDIRAGEPEEGQPVQVQTTIKNTGNHHYYGALVILTVTDSSERLVASASTKPSVWALIPEDTMTLKAQLPTPISPGTYTVKADARIGDGGPLLDTKTATISLAPSATPPTGIEPPVSGSISPSKGPTSGPAVTQGPKKIPFLPLYTPWPDFLVPLGLAWAAIFLGRRRRQ